MIDKAMKYHGYLNNKKAFHFLLFIEKYINIIKLQIDRIERTRTYFKKRKPNKKLFLKLYSDSHFYFSCIGLLDMLFEEFSKIMQNNNINKINKEFKRNFNRERRNDFEHIEQRILGIKKSGNTIKQIGDIKDFFNFSGNDLSFNGKTYTISKSEYVKLKNIYLKLIKILHDEYGMKNINFVKAHKNELRRKKIDRMTKKIIKEHNF